MVSVRIIRPTMQTSSASVKSALSDSNVGRKANFRYGEDDEDAATVATTTVNSRSSMLDMLLEPVSDETILTSCIDEPVPAIAKKVRFGSLQIHEHGMELGGSGIPRMGGAPVSLGWERQAHYHVSVIEYDDLKSHYRKGEELLLAKQHRVNFLLDSGVTMREIYDAISAADQIRRSRIVNFQKSSPSTFGKIKRGLKKVIGGIRR